MRLKITPQRKSCLTPIMTKPLVSGKVMQWDLYYTSKIFVFESIEILQMLHVSNFLRSDSETRPDLNRSVRRPNRKTHQQ